MDVELLPEGFGFGAGPELEVGPTLLPGVGDGADFGILIDEAFDIEHRFIAVAQVERCAQLVQLSGPLFGPVCEIVLNHRARRPGEPGQGDGLFHFLHDPVRQVPGCVVMRDADEDAELITAKA